MKLIFIGSGSAFTVGTSNFHSNMLLESNQNKRLLIDCGSDARLALHRLGYDYRSFDHVYISHLHADHVGGLEWYGFTRKFSGNCSKPTLHIANTFIDRLWQHTLSGGMKSLHEEVATIDNYFEVDAIEKDGFFMWEKIKFKLVDTEHIWNGKHRVPSFGLFFPVGKKHIFITTDTRYTPEKLMQFYLKADLIFHDCETSLPKSGVHSHFEELTQLPPEIKKKIWLYHYNPGELPDFKAQGFRGFVKCGQSFDLADVKTYK